MSGFSFHIDYFLLVTDFPKPSSLSPYSSFHSDHQYFVYKQSLFYYLTQNRMHLLQRRLCILAKNYKFLLAFKISWYFSTKKMCRCEEIAKFFLVLQNSMVWSSDHLGSACQYYLHSIVETILSHLHLNVIFTLMLFAPQCHLHLNVIYTLMLTAPQCHLNLNATCTSMSVNWI